MSTSSTDAVPKCRWCGQPWHTTICPLVKAMEYHADGFTLKRVEFWPTLQEHRSAGADHHGDERDQREPVKDAGPPTA